MRFSARFSNRKKITPNGAAVRVVRGEADITDFLDIPVANASVIIDLGAATVKEKYAKGPLDATKGAKVDFSSPSKPCSPSHQRGKVTSTA